MFLADYHTHSEYSPDGFDSFQEMLAAAQKRGLREFCVTDHCDIGNSSYQPLPAEERFLAYRKAQAENQTGVKFLLGIELGEGIRDKGCAEAAVAAYPYDYIIGSYHALKAEKDFYLLRYPSEEVCHGLLTRYFAELCEMAEWGCFDVLGHIDYPLRYMLRYNGHRIELLPRYEAELRKLFTLLASKGLGIELNMTFTEPPVKILSLFLECGGKIVTIGSDAHRSSDLGKYIAEGTDMCRRAGFTHVAAFEQRRVRFEKI
ncbi:MAG: PHP domain-containing protein [Oscillospiraceae bacterium]|nr:PHP domain-containing protein [Oscillospiraceae bacterium]